MKLIIKKKKGFTIIELIIVIAIIVVLAGIVAVNVFAYINKSKSTAIKENLATILSKSAGYYLSEENEGGYAGFGSFVTDEMTAIRTVQGLGNAPDPSVKSDGTDFCACASLLPYSASGSNNSYYCVDSSGTRKEYTGKAGNYCSTICPSLTGQCL